MPQELPLEECTEYELDDQHIVIAHMVQRQAFQRHDSPETIENVH